MKTKFCYGFLSTERAPLMGFAILWVMFFHSTIYVRGLFGVIKNFGNLGVDIFLLLSGVGLYYSANKIRSGTKPRWITGFYKKRILRILPATVICLTPWYLYLYRGETVKPFLFLLDITSLSFWIDGMNRGWYVALTIVLYVVYPLLFLLIRGDGKKDAVTAVSVICIVIALNSVAAIVLPDWFRAVDLALGRIPVFIAGCFLARLVFENKEIEKTGLMLAVTAVLTAILVFFLRRFDSRLRVLAIWRYMYGVLAFCVTVILAYILRLIHGTWVNKVLSFFGKYTLEIYLTHTQILTVLNEQVKSVLHSDLLINGIAVVLSVLSAIVIHEVLSRLFSMRKG